MSQVEEEGTSAAKRVSSGASAASTVFDVMEAFGFKKPKWVDPIILGTKIGAGYAEGENKHHGVGETGAEMGGEMLGSSIAEKTMATPLDMAINLVNDVVTAVGPKEASDVTGLAADMTPTKMVGNMFSQGSRAFWNLVTGDDEALERQGEEITKGEAGAPLQGYGMAIDLYNKLESGQDPEEAIIQAGSSADGTIIEKVYDTVLGDGEDHHGGHFEEEPEDGVYKPTSGNAVIDWVCSDVLGL